MLAVIRFAATKDLKYIQGKVCKPYSSVFEEHFRAHWDVPPLVVTGDDEPPVAQILVTAPTTGFAPPELFLPPSDTASIKSSKSGRSSKSFMSSLTPKSPSTAATLPHQHAEGAQMSQLHLGGSSPPSEDQKLRVVYLTEQISHYPPVPADYAACPSRHVELLGFDQSSAKVAGTSVKVSLGAFNKGMLVNITGDHGEGERYQVTHPTASVNGIEGKLLYHRIRNCSHYLYWRMSRPKVSYDYRIQGRGKFIVSAAFFSLADATYLPTSL
ncbi:hypothetical protein D9757_012717 [Collybiopsis confluens]|uniref:Uncharacterized protein n=1 Tax=Collybiopsis confluens TaxID=2823264 RepID=A0A8H5M6D1_9AGAR|nr:hypothetical protein D9757_012717 [Collybiopsis confluens]